MLWFVQAIEDFLSKDHFPLVFIIIINFMKVYVIGVGMTKFLKPGREGNPDYPEMAS